MFDTEKGVLMDRLEKKIKLVILDFDGTMGDTQQLILDTFQATIEALHLPLRSREACASTIGLPLVQAFISLFNIDKAEAEKCRDTYHNIFDQLNVKGAVVPFPCVIETIKELSARGYIVTIASSRGRGSLENYVAEFDLKNDIQFLLGVDDTVKHKPDPEPVLKTLTHFGIKADEAIIVGDTKFDILMGVRAGSLTCGVDYGNGTRDELKAAGATYIISRFSDLLKLVG